KGVSRAVAPTGAAAPGARESRFTTVDEDARRGARVQAERWALALQLAALVATLGMFAAIGWWLLKPVTADELYSALSDAWQDAPGDLRPVASEMEEFLARFPDDPRAAQVRTHAEELELQKLERKRRVQTRLGEGAEVHLAEMVYAAAVALAEAEPARAAQMLQDLLALYPATEDEAVRQYLVLARRKLEGLQAELDRQSAEQLPQLSERLRTAKGLESVDMDRAEQMYRALVRLYGDQPWASPVVADARQRLEELQDRAAPPSRAQQSPADSARADSPPADSPRAP
ncbi:MAG TPA: hypothetical protein VEQ85_03435, partial [Lacipirellulaceae bacterium]|nr:hypothetical protein [Lacipirellulaceae bacterium]